MDYETRMLENGGPQGTLQVISCSNYDGSKYQTFDFCGYNAQTAEDQLIRDPIDA
jgi:hypothetical protein